MGPPTWSRSGTTATSSAGASGRRRRRRRGEAAGAGGVATPGRRSPGVPPALELRRRRLRGVRGAGVGRRPPRAPVARLRAAATEALGHATLVDADGSFAIRWEATDDPDRVWWPVAYAGLELCLHGPLDRIKGCGGCSYLFLDETKNRSRRWCSMDEVRDAREDAHLRRASGGAPERQRQVPDALSPRALDEVPDGSAALDDPPVITSTQPACRRVPDAGVAGPAWIPIGTATPSKRCGARVRTTGRAGPDLPRLHGRRAVRRVPAPAAPGAASSGNLREPAFEQPRLARLHGHRRRGAARGPGVRERLAGRVPVVFTANASARAQAGRRVVPVHVREPLPPDGRQPQLGQRHPGVRPIARRERHLPAAARPRPAPRRPPRSWPRSTTRPPAGATCSPIPPSPTTPASAIRSTGSTSAQDRGWDVLLDAAAYLPTNVLDLSRWHPDFVAVSWYKVFGYPTGIGSLVVRREALARLRRPWFAGGTDRRRLGRRAAPHPRRRRDRLRGRHDRLPRAAGDRDRVAPRDVGRHADDPPSRAVAHAVGCWVACRRFDTPTGRRWCGSTDRPTTSTAAARSRSTCSIATATWWTSGRSRLRPPSDASRCGPAASATRAPARPPAGSPRPRWRACSRWAGSPATRISGRCCPAGRSGAVRASVGIATTERDVDRFIAFLEEFAASGS